MDGKPSLSAINTLRCWAYIESACGTCKIKWGYVKVLNVNYTWAGVPTGLYISSKFVHRMNWCCGKDLKATGRSVLRNKVSMTVLDCWETSSTDSREKYVSPMKTLYTLNCPLNSEPLHLDDVGLASLDWKVNKILDLIPKLVPGKSFLACIQLLPSEGDRQ